MQFKVPQNVDMEDKIIGPLTLVQFFYLLFGGLIIYILFSRLVPVGLGIIFWPLAIVIGLFSFAMAFLKVQDRPFPVFFISLVKYLSQPRSRVWAHYTPPSPVIDKPKTKEKAPDLTRKNLDQLQVGELAQLLDKPNPVEPRPEDESTSNRSQI